jgi:Protein of unknown function (DUF1778)
MEPKRVRRARRTERISGRTPPELRAAAERAAAADHRTLTNFVEHVLTDHLLREGFLTAPAAEQGHHAEDAAPAA